MSSILHLSKSPKSTLKVTHEKKVLNITKSSNKCLTIAKSGRGPQGPPGLGVESLEPRVESLEEEDDSIREDVGDTDFNYVDYINTLLS